ncbi:MAG TPA: neutral/alkaline non-lysosomal ceramidase N-terminal domain-containing protein [Bryobacteraceae bacterium]|nr:neutral/alkaline non-lysosomal ceramidase N-terminal domain-containing protein [Bryobacteraceae bacterium]
MYQLILLAVLASLASAKDFRAGVARIDITPSKPIWLSGYAVRTKPSEGIVHKLWAKALAIDDGRGKVIIVTTDLIGLPRAVSDVVAARAAKEYGIERARLLMNSSHTHAGPVVRPNLMTMYTLTPDQKQVLDEYGLKLVDDLVGLIGAAIGDLAPAKLTVAHGKGTFAMNRRKPLADGSRGPSDQDVPVISVRGTEGKLRAVLFGYACHNTTLGGDNYQISGDYAGFAQYALEEMQPGAVALFMLLCGGDQNPQPRGTFQLAEQHGKSLATEVTRVLATSMKPVQPALKASWQSIELAFAPHTKEQYDEEFRTGNQFRKARAAAMLRAYEERRPVKTIGYPVQAIRLGKEVTILALGGEVVVDYALRAKKEFAGTDLVVAGYSNDVMCYIPSRRVLKEGGYEAADSMIYYGQPGPFTEEVEETVFRSIYTVLGRVGIKRR